MLRLGTVPYLNALPLVEGLQEDADVQLVRAVPAALLPRLRAGELDAALVSAVELFRDPPLRWLPGPAVTCRGPVESILLFLRCEPGRIASLALDSSSLSAAAMTRVLLAEVHDVRAPRLLAAPPDAPLDTLDADAVLRIGDPALRTDPGDRRVLDLGETWTRHTGLPFVFALWLARPDVDAGRLVPRLLAAREAGLARRDELAERFAREHAMDAARCRRYVRQSIGYDLGPAELDGLRRFGRVAHELGLVDRGELPAALPSA